MAIFIIYSFHGLQRKLPFICLICRPELFAQIVNEDNEFFSVKNIVAL